MALLKLTKLLYLAERESMAIHGHMMSGDRPVSMPHGPVLSQTLDLMNGATASQSGGWEDWICDREDHDVALAPAKSHFDRDQLDELSDADIQVLVTVWQQFGNMDRWALRDWTHQHCPEWRDPKGSSAPITLESIFSAVGYSREQSRELARESENEAHTDRILMAL